MENERVIVISGGSRGLGGALVKFFLLREWKVATFSRHENDFITDLMNNNVLKDRFYWEALDSSKESTLNLFCKNVYAKFKRIDALINNAGIGNDGILTLMRSSDIDSLIDINLKSMIQLTKACTKYFLIKKAGNIINISSINGIRGHIGLSVYGATKAGIDGFTRALAKEVGSINIRVNSIAPGYLETEMTQHFSDVQRQRIIRRTPLGRLGKVEDIVSVVDFLLSPSAQFITGQTLVVDGGLTC